MTVSNAAALPGRSQPPAARVPSPSAIARARELRQDPGGAVVEGPRAKTPLEKTLRFGRRHGLLLAAVGFALAYLAGAFTMQAPVPGWAAALPLWLTAVAAVAWRVRRSARGERVPVRLEVAQGLLLVDVAYGLVQLTGDRQSPLHPLVYLLAAYFAVAPLPRRAALGLVAACVLANVLRYACTDAVVAEWHALVFQTSFTLVFALLYHLLLAARLWAARASEDEAVARRLREVEDSARSLRLIVADRSRDKRKAGDEDQLVTRLLLGAVLEVERAVGSILEGAHLALGGHALALYWLSDDDAALGLRDGRCAAGLLEPGPLGAGDGLLGTVLRHGQPLRETGRLGGVNWYSRAVSVRAVCAVPVIERTVDGTGFVRGVLVCDKLEPEPFTDKDQQLLVELASQVARAAEAERLVGELHRAKDAQDRLQKAAEELNRVATVEDVARTTVRLAGELVPGLDLCAFTRLEGDVHARTHHVAAAEGARAPEVDGLIYDDNDGLVAHVVRLGAALPARPPGLLERVKLFDLKLAGFGSLRVVPLAAAGKVLGTLAVGAKGRGLVDPESRRRLDALATLAAGALARALALHDLSLLATVDGLTGLVNRRHLDQLAQRAFQEAARYDRPLAVVVTDVDHFKKVNDTHGHAVGDEVLKAIAATLRLEARDADVVGRYGGEEFVLVLPNTDAAGAKELAERIRRRLETTPVQTQAGPLTVTMSLGVSAFPTHGATLEALVKSGDEALYEAKHAGRNRVVMAGLDKQTTPRPVPG